MESKNKRKINPRSLENLKLSNGRPVGTKNKVSRDMQETLRFVWNSLQDDKRTSPHGLAQTEPKWFYELTKGCFPKDVFVNASLDVNLLSENELDAEIRAFIESAAGAEEESSDDITPED